MTFIASAKSLPDVTILIPTWNGLSLLERFLPSVVDAAEQYLAESDARVELLIVDDASTDNSLAWLLANGFVEIATEASPLPLRMAAAVEPSRLLRQNSKLILHVVRNRKNLGFGESCNRGFQLASHELVFLLNNDVEVERDAIRPLAVHFDNREVFGVHCRVYDLQSGVECGTGKIGSFARGFLRIHRGYRVEPDKELNADLRSDLRYPSMFASGGSAMFDRNAFLSLGGFDPMLSPFYWEDVELSYRAWKRGFWVLYEPDSIARHQVSSTIGRLNPRHVRMIEQRNRLIAHWIHLHDNRLFVRHILWAMMLALTAPLRLQPTFLVSLMESLKQLSAIRKRRREEKREARRSDGEILALFKSLEHRKDLIVGPQ